MTGKIHPVPYLSARLTVRGPTAGIECLPRVLGAITSNVLQSGPSNGVTFRHAPVLSKGADCRFIPHTTGASKGTTVPEECTSGSPGPRASLTVLTSHWRHSPRRTHLRHCSPKIWQRTHSLIKGTLDLLLRLFFAYRLFASAKATEPNGGVPSHPLTTELASPSASAAHNRISHAIAATMGAARSRRT